MDRDEGAGTIPAASAVVVDDRGRVLLVRRGREPSRGRWSVPGGKVEPGESFAQAAQRETHEETGLVVSVGAQRWAVSVPTPDGRRFDIHVFDATVTGGELRAADDADDADWFTADELSRLPLVDGLLDRLESSGLIA